RSRQTEADGSNINPSQSNLKQPNLRPTREVPSESRPASFPVLIPKRASHLELDQEDENSLDDDNITQSVEWFGRKQIKIESSYKPDPRIDSLLDSLSAYLGENYATLNKFHRKLKNEVGLKLYFTFANHTQREISIHKQFIRQLKSSNFLKLGRIIKRDDRPDYIIAISHDRSDIKAFLNGVWFERYVYHKVAETLKAEGIQHEYLRNPKITYPNGEVSELDLFFLVDGKPLLLECKSGQNHDYDIEKFVRHRRTLGLNAENSIFVVLDIDESEAYIRSKTWEITAVDQIKLIEHIKATIAADDGAQDQDDPLTGDSDPEQDSALEGYDASGLAAFFKQRGLNLAPDHRAAIFDHLIPLVEQDGPISFTDIAKTIRDRMSQEFALSRRKVGEVLNCLRYSDVFRDGENQPVRNVSEPIHSIRSPIGIILERKCMEFYSRRILQLFDPDFFDLKSNAEAFERLTHGNVPSPDKIEQFKDDIAQLQISELFDEDE
ncbi:MAG: hypothetical protein WBA10_11280, partial [Elainellaceae cyanobacterium]